MNIEMSIPMMVYSLSGTNMNHTNDDNSSEQSHTNAAATRMIIRMGSCAMVMLNMANGGPKARNAQPKNSGIVIFDLECSCVGKFAAEFDPHFSVPSKQQTNKKT